MIPSSSSMKTDKSCASAPSLQLSVVYTAVRPHSKRVPSHGQISPLFQVSL